MSKLTKAQFNQIIEHELPWATDASMRLQNLAAGKAVMKLPYHQRSVKLAVTTSLNTNFLRKPSESDRIAEGEIIKLGKRLAVMEVSIFSQEEIVAHATGTYSIPPDR